jgi:translation initiation factor IF-2
MGKTRVHLLAKELEIETKDLIAQLDKLGIRGRKAQSALEDDDVVRVRAAFAAQEKPQVHVGEEKIVADRLVKSEDEGDGTEARETVVERRVRANVIRRRVNRTEVAPSETATAATEIAKSPFPEPAAPAIETAAPETPADINPIEMTPVIESPFEPATPLEPPEESQALPLEHETQPSLAVTPAPQPASSQSEAAAPEAPRGARILGRIDLKQTMRIEPAPTPLRKPPPGAPGAAGARASEADRTRPADGTVVPAGEDKPKAGRHKKRVVKKQDVLETREKELRGGRFPRKKRVLPGKEVKQTEITVPKASKRIIKISEVVTVGDLSREMGVKAGEVIKS